MLPTSLSAEREVDQLLLKDRLYQHLFLAQRQVDTKVSSFFRATSGSVSQSFKCSENLTNNNILDLKQCSFRDALLNKVHLGPTYKRYF